MKACLRYAVATVLLLLLWEFSARALGPALLPAPWTTTAFFAESLQDADFWSHAGMSFGRLMGGLGLAVLIGYPLGLWFAHCSKADWLGAPLTFITYPLPKIVLLPLLFTIVGIGDMSRVLLIALTTGYQILVIVRAEGLTLDKSYKRAFMAMGGTRAAFLSHVAIPASLPSLFTALRISSGTAIAVLFLAESFATDSGLGWLIMDAWGIGDLTRMFSGILGLSIMGVMLYAGIAAVEMRTCPWMRKGA